MAKANYEVTQLQKSRRMRNCHKKEQRAMAKRVAAEEAMTQKISGAVKDQKALAEKYFKKGR